VYVCVCATPLLLQVAIKDDELLDMVAARTEQQQLHTAAIAGQRQRRAAAIAALQEQAADAMAALQERLYLANAQLRLVKGECDVLILDNAALEVGASSIRCMLAPVDVCTQALALVLCVCARTQ
jgi:hypothetical protein